VADRINNRASTDYSLLSQQSKSRSPGAVQIELAEKKRNSEIFIRPGSSHKSLNDVGRNRKVKIRGKAGKTAVSFYTAQELMIPETTKVPRRSRQVTQSFLNQAHSLEETKGHKRG